MIRNDPSKVKVQIRAIAVGSAPRGLDRDREVRQCRNHPLAASRRPQAAHIDAILGGVRQREARPFCRLLLHHRPCTTTGEQPFSADTTYMAQHMYPGTLPSPSLRLARSRRLRLTE